MGHMGIIILGACFSFYTMVERTLVGQLWHFKHYIMEIQLSEALSLSGFEQLDYKYSEARPLPQGI